MPLGYIIATILALLVGLSLGALGGGGSIITIPLLVYVARIPAENAVGMSLVIVGTTSLLGAILHFRRGNVDLRPSLLFSVTGMAGSFIGSAGTHLLSRKSLLLMFSVIMLSAGLAMWRGSTGLHQATELSVYRSLLAGFAVGLLTGFLGIGGGFLIVPALVLFAGLDPRKAAGTSLAVIAFNSSTGILGQLRFITFDWPLLAGFLAFSLAGMIAGCALAVRLSHYSLRRNFGITIIIVAVFVALGNLLQ
ncbi:MAG TPA: sulfite exporter TauE/SafE family protein [Terriglobia bacterium]|jgi:hypothetical protein